jgi:hypothetical protein
MQTKIPGTEFTDAVFPLGNFTESNTAELIADIRYYKDDDWYVDFFIRNQTTGQKVFLFGRPVLSFNAVKHIVAHVTTAFQIFRRAFHQLGPTEAFVETDESAS